MKPWTALAVFAIAYTVNMTYITVFYHRAFAHGALRLTPRFERFVVVTGSWLTGLDALGWVCMHRRHHAYSDTADDPHSPANVGIMGVAVAQLTSYERTLVGLARGEHEFTRFVRDLDFPVNALNRRGLWALPYALHAAIGAGVGWLSGSWLIGAAYFVGLMSHPVQGWLVNAFGHAIGRRNFDTRDNSRNNLTVALLVFGEGLQNNHHAYPRSARLRYQWWEADLGWVVCRVLAGLRLAKIRQEGLIPDRDTGPRRVLPAPRLGADDLVPERLR